MKAFAMQLTVASVAVTLVIITCATATQAQPPVTVARVQPLHSVQSDYSYSSRPHYPRHGLYPHYYRPWGGTAWGNYARGIAAVTYAQGHYNRLTAEARAINAEAERFEIENDQQRADTFFAMRQANQQARAALRGPRPTAEQLADRAQQAAPDRLSDGQLDANTGQLSWPVLLQTDQFAAMRANLDATFSQRAANRGLEQQESQKVRQLTDTMMTELVGLVRQVQGADFVEAQQFIRSLAYEAQLPVI